MKAEEARNLSRITVDEHLDIIYKQVEAAAISKCPDVRIESKPYGEAAQRYGEWARVFMLGYNWNEYFEDDTGKLVLEQIVNDGFTIDNRYGSMYISW